MFKRKTIPQFRLLLAFVISFYLSGNLAYSQVYEMDNTDVNTCFGFFYDSGGNWPNLGFIGCITQGTYENNENFEKTICSDNGQSIVVTFDEFDLVGSDYLDVYDGNSTGAPLLAHLTAADGTQLFISSGTCLTFVFHSDDNGTDFLTGCDDGGNWSAVLSCADVYTIDEPGQINTCSGFFADDGGLGADYSENVTYTKTFCPGATGNCVKLSFSNLDLGTGDILEIFNGTTASGAPIYTLTMGDPIPPLGVGSESGDCLTIKFTSNGDGSVGEGWLASVYCPPSCGTPPECTANDPADNQCINATPICNLNGYCGSTSNTYNSTDHLGNDWNSVGGLMDDFCGSVENNSWLSFVAGAATATLNVWTSNCANSEGIQMQVYSTADCEDFTPMSNCVSYGYVSDFVIEAEGLTIGETYYLMIDGFAGDNCDYIIAAGSGISVGAEITQSQTICPMDIANISVDGADIGTTTYEWWSVPADPTLAGQENNYTIVVSPTDTTTYYCAISGPSSNPNCGPLADTLQTMVFVLDASHPFCQLDVSCNIAAAITDTLICNGETTSLSSTGSVVVSLLANDFNDGTPGINWSSTTAATFTNPCGAGPDGTYLWMGNISPAPRNLTSTDFDVSNGGTISFFMRYAIQSDGTPCEGPDEPDEGISLQYSTNFGTTWTNIRYFNPYIGFDDGSVNNPGTSSPFLNAGDLTSFTSWAQYTYQIPLAAQTGATRFRWIQTASTTLDNDHWGLDSICIVTPPPGVTYAWTSIPPGFSYIGQNPGTVAPTVSTDYIVTASAMIEGAPYSCQDTVHVTVMDVTASFTVNNPSQCLDGNVFNFINTGSTGSNIQYSWDFGDGSATSTDINPVHSYSTNGTFQVTQSVSYNGNCTETFSMNVTIFNDPTLTFSPSIESCYMSCDGSITANPNGTGPFTFAWNNGQTTQTAINLCGGIYSVIITDGNGCTNTDSYQLNSRDELLIASTSSTQTSCYTYNDGTAYVEATGGTGAGTYAYQWDSLANYQVTQTAAGLTAGNYIVTVTDANGCTISTDIDVAQPTQVIVSATSSTTICYGQNTIISGIPSGGNGAPYQVIWSKFPFTIIDTAQSIEIAPTQSTDYYVIAYDAMGCISPYDTVKITVMNPLSLNLLSPDPYLCLGDTAIVAMNFSGGTGGPYMIYQIEGPDQFLVIPPLEVVPEETDTVIVTIRDGCSIPVSDTIIIEVLPETPINIAAYPTRGCQPLKVQFTENTPDEGQTYMWHFGDNSETNISIMKNPEHTYDHWGVYDVTLEVTSDSGCVHTYTEDDLITVYRTPNAAFYPHQQEASRIQPSVFFENMSDITFQSFWNFGDGSDGSTEVSPTWVYPPEPQDYTVELVIKTPDPENCIDTARANVEIQEIFTFYAPSAFAPDGSNEDNRIFRVFGFGLDERYFRMLIYDRWGELVYESFNFNHGWNGKVKDGSKIAESAVYMWVVDYTDLLGNQHQRSGTVTLIR